jgi:hypothetical protein
MLQIGCMSVRIREMVCPRRVWVESVQTDERLQSCKATETFITRASYAISRRVVDYGFVLLEAIGLSAACRLVLSGRECPQAFAPKLASIGTSVSHW